MRAGRSILSVSRAAVDRVNFSVRRNLLVETGWRPDCISQPGSPVSTTQHVKAAYEQSTVGPTQVHSSGALLQDNELVPQYPYFGSQPPPRPEAVVQQPDEKQANCDHQPQSCFDSVAVATPADGVFGSDTRKQVCDSPLHGLAWLAAQEHPASSWRAGGRL
jgi:hypothetical protein